MEVLLLRRASKHFPLTPFTAHIVERSHASPYSAHHLATSNNYLLHPGDHTSAQVNPSRLLTLMRATDSPHASPKRTRFSETTSPRVLTGRVYQKQPALGNTAHAAVPHGTQGIIMTARSTDSQTGHAQSNKSTAC